MDNEPQPPPSPTPPPPDLSKTPPPSPGPPPPSLTPPPPAPPPPPGLLSSVEPPPKPKVTVKKDAEEEEDALPPAGSEAPFNPRIVAAIIDGCVGAGLYIVFIIIRVPLLGVVANLGYWLVRDALPFLNGQSVGKKAMKLRAVTLEGKSLSGDWKSSAIRNLSLVIPFLNLVDLYLLWQKNEKGGKLRRLGDDWAKTKVIVAAEEPEPVTPAPPQG